MPSPTKANRTTTTYHFYGLIFDLAKEKNPYEVLYEAVQVKANEGISSKNGGFIVLKD